MKNTAHHIWLKLVAAFFLVFLSFSGTALADDNSIQVSPQNIAPGSIIVLSSPDEKFFNSDLTKNQVIFTGSSEKVTPILAASDNKKFLVTVPGSAKSGYIKLIVDGTEKGTTPPIKIVADSNDSAFYRVFGATILIFILLLLIVVFMLKKSDRNWDLGEALSEDVQDDNKLFLDPATKMPVLVSSSSRLIALIGLSSILAINMGIAAVIFWGYFVNHEIPELSGIGWYLFGQAAIFAPYIANQARSAFK